MKNNILMNKSMTFAVRIVRLSFYLQKVKREFVLSKQLLRSGTSVGALIREAQYAQSKLDFINKLSIAIKEANETAYWLELFFKTGLLTQSEFDSLIIDCIELRRLLSASISTSKRNLNP